MIKLIPNTAPRLFLPNHLNLMALMILLLAASTTGIAQETKPIFLPSLSTAGNPRLPGKFVWADLVTDDVAAAQKFYGGLFGWSFSNYGGYVIGKTDDRPICGIFQRPRPTDQPQARPRWFGYISVANIDKARNAVLKAGGRELAAPKKLPDRGEQAVFADAEGALFGVVKSSFGDPEDFLADPGDWIWIQLLSRDAEKASEFYRAVGGYDIIENDATNRQSDYVLTSEGYARATVRTIRSADTRVQPTWLPFVRVLNVSESVAKARQLGGKILVEPSPELLDSKVALIADPTGAAIGILEWNGKPVKGGKPQ
jgi:predicted enzyme related to lactoylglutathione lyase